MIRATISIASLLYFGCCFSLFGQANYRLIGYSNYTDGGNIISDSLRLSYSNGRGGKVMFNGHDPVITSLRYDTCDVYRFNNPNYIFKHSRIIMWYNGNGTLKSKITQGLDSVSMNWVLLDTLAYTYDSHKNLIFELEQISAIGGLNNYRRHFYKYDQANGLTLDSMEAWAYGQNMAFWQPDVVGNFQYDQNHNRIFEHFKIGGMEGSKIYYTYTNNNLLQSSKEEDYNWNNSFWFWSSMNMYRYNSFSKTDTTLYFN